MSMTALCEKIIAKQNPTVMGLDPKLAYIPERIQKAALAACPEGGFAAAAEALLLFNQELIDATCDLVAAVKPQVAYYEMYGWQGMRAYEATIRYAREKGLYVIADVKRNDIGSTAEAYSAAYLGKTALFGAEEPAFGADSATVNPYLGSDGVAPFIADCKKYHKSIFMLVKTSNRSSGELQDRVADGKTVYAHMAEATTAYGADTVNAYGYSCCGAVVGATYPAQLSELRALAPHTFFLVPGYGAQGAGAADVAGAFDKRGLGAVINSSRGIMCAYQKGDWTDADVGAAARAEVIRMRDELVGVIGGKIG